jgi:hypothetical protein
VTSKFNTSIIIGDSWKATNMLLESGAKPPVVKIHNSLDQARAIHNRLGNDTIVVVRMTGSEWAMQRGKPAGEAAVNWCQVTEPAFKSCPWAYFEVGPPLQTADKWYADFQIAAMNWMYARGYKAVVCTFGEGNPEVPSGGGDGWAPMRPVVQLAASYGYLLGPQAYWVDGNMDINDDWHMFRIYRVFRDYPGMFPNGTRIFFSETGIDLRERELGWRRALGNNWPKYRAGLRLLSSEINRRSTPPGVQVIGGTVFAIHEVDNEWRDFNFLEHLPDLLADIKSGQDGSIVEVPPPPSETVDNGLGTITMRYPANGWVNIRDGRSAEAPVVGRFLPTDTATIGACDTGSVGKSNEWLFINGTSSDPCLRGWSAAWLYKYK